MKKITANQLKNLVYKAVNNPQSPVPMLGPELEFKNLEVTGVFYGLSFNKFKKDHEIFYLKFTDCIFKESFLIKQSAKKRSLEFIAVEKCQFEKSVKFYGSGLSIDLKTTTIKGNFEASGIRCLTLNDVSAKETRLQRNYGQREKISLSFGKITTEQISTGCLLDGEGISIESCHVSMLPIITSLFPNHSINRIYTDKNEKLVVF